MLVNTIVTFFGAGLAPKAPGTMGSLAAMPFVVLAHQLHAMEVLAVVTLLAALIGVWASRKYLEATGKTDDPKEIVIDEVAGQWLVFAAMPLMYLPASYNMLWIYAVGFAAFRFFDILKPWPICVIDRNMKGPWGIMLDDIAAAVAALVLLGGLGHSGLF
jgi:Phosphatidylglycerophosphatase A and related proteins